MDELVRRYNAFDWTDGLVVWQSRIQGVDQSLCKAGAIGGICHPELHPTSFDLEVSDAVVGAARGNWRPGGGEGERGRVGGCVPAS